MKTLRPERLNLIAGIIEAKSYLEIGVCKGLTFNRVNIQKKDAVDPNFRFDTTPHESQDVRFFEKPSDSFFGDNSLVKHKYDLIYLDGLHEFNQTYRDFCNSLAYSHDDTVWLIDDTNPTSYEASLSSQSRTKSLRTNTGLTDNAWMGDVYRVVYAIHDFFPQFHLSTYKSHGQTVIWKNPNPRVNFLVNDLGQISNLDYASFVESRDICLNFASDEEIYSELTERFKTIAVQP